MQSKEDEREFRVAVTHSIASATAATASATEVQPRALLNYPKLERQDNQEIIDNLEKRPYAA